MFCKILFFIRFLGNLELSDKERPVCIDMCMEFHTGIQRLSDEYLIRLNRHNYVTPTSYLEMIKTFKDILEKKRVSTATAKTRYINGIEQLENAKKQISILKDRLEEVQPQLRIATETVGKQLAQVQADSEKANNQREQVMNDEAIATEQADIANAIKEDCDVKMAEAMPALNAAEESLQSLNPGDITLIRTMKTPPGAVKIVMEGICILKDLKADKVVSPSGTGTVDDYWLTSKKMLQDVKFLDSLVNFEKVCFSQSF